MADIYQVTLRNKETGEEITREYDLDYLDEKNGVINRLWKALMQGREDVKF